MSSPFAIISTAWGFYRKHPMLNEIAFWLFFLPVGAIDALGGLIGTVEAQEAGMIVNGMDVSPTDLVIMLPLIVVLVYLMIWGQACVLVVAKRMLAGQAGRTRTSFSAVRKQARKFISALFLTELLRSLITTLLLLLLIVPGVIYSIRTVFYGIMMIENGKIAYGRDALHPSIALVKGRTWDVLWRIVVIGFCIALPLGLIDGLITGFLVTIDTRLETLALVLTDFVDAFMGMFFIVCTVALYADLKGAAGQKTRS